MPSLRCFLVVVSTVLYSSISALALNNGVARTPPMGWNSWNTFALYPSDQLIRQTADTMVSSGMKDAGYRYVNIDDGWVPVVNDVWKRNASGGLVPGGGFPNMRNLTSYVHGKELYIGIYINCYAAANHEQQDADSFVAWGIDYLKYDFCETQEKKVLMRNALKNAVKKARDAGNASAHEIVYSLSLDWYDSWLPGDTTANLWRTYNDIDPNGQWPSVLANADNNDLHYAYGGPGGWNDADMLVVGKALTASEDRAHFSLWCIMASPLIAGNDIRNMSAATIAILTNKEAIALNQDSLGIQGRKIKKTGNLEVWVKRLRNDDLGVCFLNRGTTASDISISWNEIATGLGITLPSSKAFTARDIWKAQDLGSISGTYTARAVPSHDVTLLRLSSGTTAIGYAKNSPVKSIAPLRFVDGRTIIVPTMSDQADVVILNARGAVILSQKGSANEQQIDITGKSKGIYFVTVHTATNSSVHSVVVR